MSKQLNLEAIMQCFSSVLNCVLQQGCRITQLIDQKHIRIEFGIRGSNTERIDYTVPISEIIPIDNRQINYADELSALMIFGCLGFEAEIDGDCNCILISRDGDYFELRLAAESEEELEAW